MRFWHRRTPEAIQQWPLYPREDAPETRAEFIRRISAKTATQRRRRAELTTYAPTEPTSGGEHFLNSQARDRFTRQGVIIIEKVLPSIGMDLVISAEASETPGRTVYTVRRRTPPTQS